VKSLSEIRSVETGRARRDLAWCAFSLMKGGDALPNAADFARRHGQERAMTILRAAVGAGGVGHPEWAGSLADAGAMQASFLASLRGVSAFDTMLPDMLRLPTRIAGVRVQTAVLEGATRIESRAKPVNALSFQSPIMDRFTSTALVVISDTVLALAPAEAVRIIEQELVRGVVAAIDRDFLSLIADGASSIASSGSTAAAVLQDVENALAAMTLGTASRVYMIAPSAVVRSLALKADTTGARAFPSVNVTGGQLAGVTVVPTDQAPTVASPSQPLVVLADASRIGAWSEGVGLDRATHASIEMSDQPLHSAGGALGSPAPATAANLVNLWQVNASGFRAERWWSAARLENSAVCVISGAAW
jgi:hypothetical protein